jgi:hypothetical protein
MTFNIEDIPCDKYEGCWQFSNNRRSLTEDFFGVVKKNWHANLNVKIEYRDFNSPLYDSLLSEHGLNGTSSKEKYNRNKDTLDMIYRTKYEEFRKRWQERYDSWYDWIEEEGEIRYGTKETCLENGRSIKRVIEAEYNAVDDDRTLEISVK